MNDSVITKTAKLKEFSDLLGKTLTDVRNVNDVQIIFTLDSGESYQLYHSQDCCESVTVEDINGELSGLVGSPILMAEVVSHSNENPPEVKRPDYQDSFTWTFYKLATIKGYVTIRWYGESNGYYSEEVDFGEV